MQAAAQSLHVLSAEHHYIGGQIGILVVLHAWGKGMVHHPHVHCLVPADGLTSEGESRPAQKIPAAGPSPLADLSRKFMPLAR